MNHDDFDPIIRRRLKREADRRRNLLIVAAATGGMVLLAGLMVITSVVRGSIAGPESQQSSNDKYCKAAMESASGFLDQVRFVSVEGPEFGRFTSHPQSFTGWSQDIADEQRRKDGKIIPDKKTPVAVVRLVFTHADHLNHRGRRVQEDWLFWLDDEMGVVDWSDNPGGDDWQAYVRQFQDR